MPVASLKAPCDECVLSLNVVQIRMSSGQSFCEASSAGGLVGASSGLHTTVGDHEVKNPNAISHEASQWLHSAGTCT